MARPAVHALDLLVVEGRLSLIVVVEAATLLQILEAVFAHLHSCLNQLGGPYYIGSAVFAPECGDFRESCLKFTVVTAALRLCVARAVTGLARGACCSGGDWLSVVLVDVGAFAGLVVGLLLRA